MGRGSYKVQKILTVSVAAYNVEQFLVETLDSLADARYVDKLEVFVVDDGGKDGSLDIAKSYEARFPGTFHAIHKENGGYGSTVNHTIPLATGKYFKLLDGDDWMDRDGLAEVLALLENCDEDAVVTKYRKGPGEGEMETLPREQEAETVVRVREYETAYPFGMWRLFYRTEMLRASGLHMLEHTLYTDQIYSTVPFATAETIRFVHVPVYCYRFGREEQSMSKPARRKHADDMLRVCDYLFDFYEAHREENRYLKCRIFRYYIQAMRTLMILPVNRKNRRKLIAYEREAKAKHPDIYASATVENRLGNRFMRLMRRTNYAAYWLLWLIPDGKV